jgi:hypothetical protein
MRQWRELAPKIKFSPDVGVGYEFASFSKWHFFTELHYNPDAIKMVIANVGYWHRMWELRLELIYQTNEKHWMIVMHQDIMVVIINKKSFKTW